MTLCEEMDPTFNIDRVCFSHQDIFKQVDKMDKKGWLTIDEPALSGIASKRTWINEAQQALVDLIESFRFKNLGVCFCTISSQLLDKTIRELLMHYMVWVVERGFARIYSIEASQFSSDVRTPFLGDAYFELPSQELIDAYEKKRSDFIHSRYYRSLNQIQTTESATLTLKDIIEDARANVNKLRNSKGEIDVSLIQTELGVGKQRAYNIKSRLIDEKY